MPYQIEFVGESDLPAGVDWAATDDGGACCLFVKVTTLAGRVPAEAIRAIRGLAFSPKAQASVDA